MVKSIFVFLLFFFTGLSVNAGQITGNIDSVNVSSASGPSINGWACDSGVASSISVHLYAGGPAGQGGTFVKTVTTSVANETAVNTACGTPVGTRHRFSIPLTSSDLVQFGDKGVYVHGISKSGGGNLLISSSGAYKIPAPNILGGISGVGLSGTDVKVTGWACQYGIAQSINVHLYAGGPAGSGTFVKAATANLPNAAAQDAACGTSGVPRVFQFTLTANEYANHRGKAVYVHGLRVVGSVPNAAIANSGNFKIPDVAIYKLSQKLAGLPAGSDLKIAQGERVIIDTNADLGILTVNGQLACPQTGNYQLKSQGILVEGSNALFECGNASGRFAGTLSIYLKPGRDLFSGHSMGERAFAAMGGGTIRLFGDGKRIGWRRIAATVTAGSKTVQLPTAATDWKVGDRIVIGPTGFKFDEADERIITAIDSTGKIITVNSPFTYNHFGQIQTYKSGTRSWNLDERAEIANLTRNIRILPTGADADLDSAQFGGHVMIMAGSFGYIDGVEFVRMGQMGRLGRYPFHWHLAGHVPGQFIRNSSIRNSYQRCLSVHGTHDTVVENNVCYNHFGHGFFLENGSETGNSFIGNLSMVSRRIPLAKAVLISDAQTSDPSRFSASSGFWISNPDNTVRGNVASGAQGTGFWMSFSQVLRCDATNHCEVGGNFAGVDIYPARTPTRLFANNVAHSADVGINWDGAADGNLTNNAMNALDRVIVATHYFYDSLSNPSAKAPIFDNLVVFKNRRTGIYYRGDTSEFRNLMAADNADSLFFAYNQVVRDSLVVGLSAGTSASDLTYLNSYLRTYEPIHGVRLYDGPFDLVNVHFADFPAQELTVGTWKATPVPFYAIGGFGRFLNSVRGLTFAPRPLRKFDFDSMERASIYWQDGVLTSAIRDLDGSLAGVAGAIVRPNRAMNLNASCVALPGETASRCNYKMGILNLGHTGVENNTHNNINMKIERNDGPAMQWDGKRYFNKVGLIAGNTHTYRLTLAAGAIPSVLRMIWSTDTPIMSPVIELAGLKSTCNLSGGMQISDHGAVANFATLYTSSMSQLQGITSMNTPMAIFQDPSSGRVYVRFYSLGRNPVFTSANAANATSQRLEFSCP